MELCKMTIRNFRGIKAADIYLTGNSVFVGDNNSGKSTIFEAIDLVMGPDRMSHRPVVDEHDFYAGDYIQDGNPIEIFIESVVIGLSSEQERHFNNYIEWWNCESKVLIQGPPAGDTDQKPVVSALRLCFKGSYDFEEDDFIGQTYFSSAIKEDGTCEPFRTKDKRLCGFLYLRTLRTGNRALSLEHGSLLDIILRLRELRPQMWENILTQLQSVSIAAAPELGISDILSSVQDSLSSIVTLETANKPQIRVSSLTREHLRKILTVFMGSGVISSDGTEYSTPYYHQGTGTINTLVLSLLSMIAELKQNVIFAMEEPEIALPPHIQKRVVFSIISKSAQALFTSHSPYVLEEFDPTNIIVVSRENGMMNTISAGTPPSIKKKQYREELRKRFCESLLARRVLITEGRTEYDVYSSVARMLQNLHPEDHFSFELLGISLVNAETDSQIASLGAYYKRLKKSVFAIFDKQAEPSLKLIRESVNYPYEAQEVGIENVVLNGSDEKALKRYALLLVDEHRWPQHLAKKTPCESMKTIEIKDALFDYFKWGKGDGTLSDFLEQCNELELPAFIVNTVRNISQISDDLAETAFSTDNHVEEEERG